MAKTSKKATYTPAELAEVAMRKFPGHYKDHSNAVGTVNYFIRRLGIGDINSKKKYKQISSTDAERVIEAMSNSYKTTPRKRATPIERAVKNAEMESLKAQLDANLEKIKENEIKLAVQAVNASAPQVTPYDERQKEADYFEVRRKRFYTDVNYFLKLATTPSERVAIWEALGKLYGLKFEKPADWFDASKAAKNPTAPAAELPNFSLF